MTRGPRPRLLARRGPGPRTRLAVLVVGLLSAFLVLLLSGSYSTEKVQDWMDGFGWAGPFVFVIVSALLTVAMFPGPLLAGAAGLLFGTAVGTVTSIVASTLGAVLAFLIGRFVAGDVVEELGGPRLKALAGWVGRRGFTSVLYSRLPPGMPFNVINYACGLAPLAVLPFALATAIGVAPRAFAYAALGGSFGNFGSPETIIAIAVLVAMGVGGLIVVRRDLRRERRLSAAAPPGAEPGTGSSSPAPRSAGPP